MTSDNTHPPARTTDPESEPGSAPRIVHPLLLLGWPGFALRVDGSRPPRRPVVRRRRRKRVR
jgi:hypothetical protein